MFRRLAALMGRWNTGHYDTRVSSCLRTDLRGAACLAVTDQE